MIFKICKCQNKSFNQANASNFEGLLRYYKVMGCYDFWVCCESLNEENFKPNFISLELN
jgi:hypothetical protein